MDTRVGKTRALLLLVALFYINSHVDIASVSAGIPSYGKCLSSEVRSFSFHEPPINVSASLADSRTPALAVSGFLEGSSLQGDTVHVVWEEGTRVYHRFCHGGTWSPIRSVATGEQPAIAIDVSGIAHLVFVNEFGGNYEIYYCRWNGTSWSLPRNVSNTSGISAAPSLAIAPDGMPHVVWADNTPGYNVIYHAYWDGMYWINEPIPNAMGGAPAVSVSAGGVVHVVWQDRDAPGAPYEIYYSRWNGKDWSLPENLSDSAAEQSIIPSIATDRNNETSVVWQEKVSGKYAIYYTRGRVGFWSVPEKISDSGAEAYLPSIAAGPSGTVYAGWDESTLALYRQRGMSDATWSPFIFVISDPMGVTDLQLAVDVNGRLYAVWARRVAAENWDIFYQNLSYKLVLPLVLKKFRR